MAGKPRKNKIDNPIYKPVVVNVCPVCGYNTENSKIASLETRFACEECGTSIANTQRNRCTVCGSLCADTDSLVVHRHRECPHA